MIKLNIDLLELNDLYYAVGKHRVDCEEQIKEYGDSEYFHKQLQRAEALETKVQNALYDRVNEMQEAIDYIDEVVENEDTIAERREDAKHEKAFSHFVDNDEADFDALMEREYKKRQRFNGVSQAILDYVERTGNVSYKMLNDFYRQYTNGSNSLSHILKALLIPYKNRPTRRFLRQIARGTYAIDYATQYNWVVNDVYDYND